MVTANTTLNPEDQLRDQKEAYETALAGIQEGDATQMPTDEGEVVTKPPVEPEPDPVTVGDNVTGDDTGLGAGYRELAGAATEADSGAYDDYDNPTDDIAALAPTTGQTFSTPETTVAGQLEKLLDKGGSLQQQAQVQARERASALGMMSSTAAIGASRRADVTALMPAAQQDAETMAKFKLQEQQTANKIKEIQVEGEVSGSLTQQKAEIAEQQTRIAQEWEGLMKGLDAEQQKAMEDVRGGWQMKFEEFKGKLTKELQQQEIDAEITQSIINNANGAMNDYQITVQTLLANDSFLDNFGGDPKAMKQFFDDLFVTVETSIAFQTKTANVYYNEDGTESELAGYISDLADENEWWTAEEEANYVPPVDDTTEETEE